jgi:hypothetical protein
MYIGFEVFSLVVIILQNWKLKTYNYATLVPWIYPRRHFNYGLKPHYKATLSLLETSSERKKDFITYFPKRRNFSSKATVYPGFG